MSFFIEYNFIFTYIRLVCYALIILTDLRNVTKRKFSTMLYVGDILLSFALFVTALNIPTTKFPQELVADRVMTPAAIVWAGIHFYEFLKRVDVS